MNKLPIIKKGYHAGMDFQSGYKLGSSFFLYTYFVVILLFFIVLVMRLFHLTIVKGEYYRQIAEGNRIRETVIEAKRGTLIDRKGIVLVQNIQPDMNSQEQRLFSSRHYEEAEALSPLIGYRQVADNQDIKADPCLYKITLGDKVGKKGIEKIYECELRGKNGKKLVEVDASSKIIKPLSVISPQAGKTLQLAVDSELQKKAYDLIKDKRAVVVGIKPQTGEVLVLASSPSFNPSDFEKGNAEKISQYFTDKDKPLFNRAVEGTYPPGSVFKLVLALGALEGKKVNEDTVVEDTGKIKAGPIEFGNWYFLEYGKTEGAVNMVKAIQRSNDIYFYKIGEKMGSDQIKFWAERLGYGKKSGIKLEEAEGIIPSSFWKEEVLKEQWYLGDTYNLSIGQGYILVTPLQVAQSTAAVANKGRLCKPKLLKIGAQNDALDPKDKQSECKNLPINKKTIDIIHQGMVAACSTGGTGWPLFEFSATNAKGEKELLPVACKTGTAESHAESKLPHAWFTVFAPVTNPEIVLTVLVEEGGQGSDVAAPIAKEILQTYFERAY